MDAVHLQRAALAIATGLAIAAALTLPSREAAAKDATFKCNFNAVKNAPLPGGPALTALTRGAMSPIPLNSVQIVDKNIRRKVLVQGLFARRTGTDTLEIIARIANCSDYPLQVEGRTSFQDGLQIPTEPVSAWQRVFLPPRSLGTYREVSTNNSDVKTFLVELREGN